ncbi:hypothetical protein GCM10009799_44330 [Nocardiopsis rhodophaea]|uniref:MgsA AAA+ ATPase C-terminal domain-containing protein n=1 Tax=Nocardiopsis rhodophaea TaxID=280238 RepID=A0ABP5F1Q2_9ACTN
MGWKITGIDEAMADVRAGAVGEVPAHPRCGRYASAEKLGNAVGYRYPTPPRRSFGAAAPAGRTGREKDYYRPHSAQRGTRPA